MATIPQRTVSTEPEYPTSDGRPMAETDWHRDLMVELIDTLKMRYADDPSVYVSGNLLVYYVQGDKRKHVAPDVFLVRGAPKHNRKYYLIWEEPKGPDVVIELTSQSTRREDVTKKFNLYQDVLRVPEYFLFDPFEEYLRPSQQGYRWREEKYVAIEPVGGRLPSAILGLHLERNGTQLRLFDPVTGNWLPTPTETREQVEQENQRLRQELESRNGNL
jgi:Uma2 family endonuclease